MNAAPRSNGTILVVDDLPATISFVRTALEEVDYKVLVATNGQEALKRAALTGPDLILLDVLMPGMDGYETCKQLKGQETTKDIPIIFMTVITETVDKVKGFQLGAVDYLAKPIETEELLARVKTHLTIARLQQELQAANAGLEQQVEARSADLRAANEQLQVELAERENAEAALRVSEEKYRSLIQKVQVAIVLHDGEGRILIGNPMAQRLLGLSEDQLLGRELVDPDWRFLREDESVMPMAEYPVSLVLTSRKPLKDYVAGIHQPDQDEITWVLVNAEPEFDDAGEIAQIIVSFIDLTEHKQAEEALRESEELYRVLTENSNDLIALHDNEGRHVYLSPSFVRFLGRTPEDSSGFDYDRVHPEDIEAVQQIGEDVLAGKTKVVTYRYLDAKESWRWIKGRAGRVHYRGKPHIMSVSHDITEQKRAEAEIHQLNQQLEQRVLERTAQFEAVNKELEAFAYSVSHDLRAPLRHIDGFVELLREKTQTTLDDQARRYMEMISESARKMGILIDNLLSFSRMGRNELLKSQVDLDKLVQDVIREFEPETEGRDVRWKLSPLPVIAGDQAMLRIVLANLVANSLKFTRPRQPAEIEIGCLPDQENEVVVFIRDNGVGFDMAYADKLFGVFQRLHHADEFEGTGIGLASVRRIIDRHGGRTWAEGKIDQGATFYFSLP